MLYPFGYGLSYSDFAYEKIESFKQDKKNIRVTVSVKNTSGRDGEEVVQLYASYPESKVERPSKQLRAFRRIPIKAGETRKVTLTVPKEELGYWNEGKQMFRCRTRNGEAADRGFIGRYTVGGKDQAIRMKKPSLNIPTIKISELCHNNVANPLITYLQA